MIELICSFCNDISLQRSASVGGRHLDGMQLIHVLHAQTVTRFGTPKQLAVGRKNLLRHCGIDYLVHCGCVENVGITHDTE